jgi:carboxymethylenebutenolidase
MMAAATSHALRFFAMQRSFYLQGITASLVFAVACSRPSSPPPESAPAVPSAPTSAPAAAPPPPAPATSSATAQGQTVAFLHGGSGWLVTPAGSGKHPALVLVPEWWGLNDWIKSDAARFASEGYVAIAVDIYRGKATADPGEAHELMRGLPEDRALEDMKDAFDALAARPDVEASHIGSIGWCMGGGYSLAFAVAEPRLKAAVVNYGKLVTAKDKIAGIHAALLGNFAGEDRGISPEDVKAFAKELAADHKDADVKIYDGAKHAFMNPNNKDGFNEVAAKDAWARTDAFFTRVLK